MNLTIFSIIVTGVIALILLVRENTRRYKKGLFWILIILLVIEMIFGIIIYMDNAYDQKYNERFGITTGKIYMDAVLRIGGINNGARFVGDGIVIGNDQTRGFMNVLGMRDIIRSWKEDDKLMISTTIRNREGKIIALVNGDEWMVNENLILDKNFDDRGLEVMADTGEIILQIDKRYGETYMAEVTYLENGEKLLIGPLIPGQESMGGVYFDNNSETNLSLAPMFKYPSKLHQAERTDYGLLYFNVKEG